MTTITVYVRPDEAAKLDYISVVCRGIGYEPVEIVKVNDLYKCTFRVNTSVDTAPALGVSVSDGIRTGEHL